MFEVHHRLVVVAWVLAGSACGSTDAGPLAVDLDGASETGDGAPDGLDSEDMGDTPDTPDTPDAPDLNVLADSPDAAVDDTGETDTAEPTDTLAGDTGDDDSANEPTTSWDRLPDLPTVLQEHAVLALDGTIYLLGGFQNLTLVSAVRTWTPQTEAFALAPELPRALHHLNAAAADGRIWVLGSLEGFNFAATGDGWVLDPGAVTPAWTQVASMPSARRRGSAAVAVVGTDVYLLGGFRGGAVAECDVYRTAEDRWDALPSLPGARDHAGAVAIDGRVYLVGGRQGAIGSVEANLWRLDPADEGAGWVALSPMPTARGGIAVGVVAGPGGGRLVVVGGEGNPAAESGVFPQVESYDPATDTWESLPPMPAPRHGMQAVGIGSLLFVPGGADVEAFGATKHFDVLRFTHR